MVQIVGEAAELALEVEMRVAVGGRRPRVVDGRRLQDQGPPQAPFAGVGALSRHGGHHVDAPAVRRAQPEMPLVDATVVRQQGEPGAEARTLVQIDENRQRFLCQARNRTSQETRGDLVGLEDTARPRRQKVGRSDLPRHSQ